MKQKLFVISMLLVVILSANLSASAQDSQTLTVFAASSLIDAFEDIATDFEAANAGVDVLFNFGGSSSLATQLVEGAPADVFASANNTQMNVARDGERIDGSPHVFVKNRLVLIVPADNPADIQSLADLANDGIDLVVAAEGVPVRDYTNTMLDRLAADESYGEEYRTAFMANIVSEEENVRQVSAKVALGEAEAGIVYLSDVTPDIAEDVIALPIPDALNTIATYPIAITNDAANPELAQSFVDYVLSDAGQDTLVDWGFISVHIPEQPMMIAIPDVDANSLTVDGQVLNPFTLTADDLRENYSSETVDVTFLSGEDTVTTSFTGVRLWDILSAAQANFNADIRNDKLSMFVVVTASDGYQAVIAWGEIDPEFGNQPILVAYGEAGVPIEDEQGGLRLVVPSDARGGRYVSGIVNISLRDAPAIDRE
ncbi:MAG: molybdate ABC transporter substrate-binding protein [Burkholderiales bacterium]|nr:molybdate ABC transporter substrate-binding protein [Anaerolineae bacterium]